MPLRQSANEMCVLCEYMWSLCREKWTNGLWNVSILTMFCYKPHNIIPPPVITVWPTAKLSMTEDVPCEGVMCL